MQKVLSLVLLVVLASSTQTQMQSQQILSNDIIVIPQARLVDNLKRQQSPRVQTSTVSVQSIQNASQSSRTQDNTSSSQLNNTKTQNVGGKTKVSIQSTKDSSLSSLSQKNTSNSSLNKTKVQSNGINSQSQSQSTKSQSQKNQSLNNNNSYQSTVLSYDPNGVSNIQYNKNQYNRDQKKINKAGSQKKRNSSLVNGDKTQSNSQSQYNTSTIQTNQRKNNTYFTLSGNNPFQFQGKFKFPSFQIPQTWPQPNWKLLNTQSQLSKQYALGTQPTYQHRQQRKQQQKFLPPVSITPPQSRQSQSINQIKTPTQNYLPTAGSTGQQTKRIQQSFSQPSQTFVNYAQPSFSQQPNFIKTQNVSLSNGQNNVDGLFVRHTVSDVINPGQASFPQANSQSSNNINASILDSQNTYYCPQLPKCQFNYRKPVCATMGDGSMKYIRNNCDACLQGAVSYQFKKCPRQSRDILCGPVSTQPEEKYCLGVQEVCGDYENGWIKQFSTGCEACSIWMVRSYTLGIC